MKIPFRNEGKIKTFSDKRESVTSNLMLNEKSRAFFRWKENKLRWKKDDERGSEEYIYK